LLPLVVDFQHLLNILLLLAGVDATLTVDQVVLEDY
jgi:hypothetical protein